MALRWSTDGDDAFTPGANKSKTMNGRKLLQHTLGLADFDGTTVSGTYHISVCGTTISFDPEPKPWSAEWMSP